MDNILKKIDEATSYIRSHINEQPEIAIILGSGLGPLAKEIDNPVTMKYADIPNFCISTISGHAGELIYGTICNRKVLVMNGRFHYYEGHDMDVVTLPIRVFSKLGIKDLIVTNAAGGIKDSLKPGSIMLINDHLSFMCPSPLRGTNLDDFGTRFPDMTQVYTYSLLELAKACARTCGIEIQEGVYCYFKGPQYETPAEIRAVRAIGADAAGMSTVPEAIAARHSGMRILGISLITNKASGLGGTPLSHQEVKSIAQQAENNMVALVKEILSQWQ